MKSYLAVLGMPGAWRFLVPAFLARLPFAMVQIGTLLLVHWATGSYGWGGIAAAAAAVAQAFVGPQTGRLADRYGQAKVLVPQVLLHAILLGSLLVLAQAKAQPLLLVLTAGLAGASMPQVGSMVRARWANLLKGDELGTAFAVESITDELTFTIAPIILIAVATGYSPTLALLVALILVVLGTLFFATVKHGAPQPKPASATKSRGVLRMRGVAVLAGAMFAVGSVFGSMQVGITSLAEKLGDPGAAGPIYGTFSAASMVGGLAYGALRWKMGLSSRMALLLALLSAAVAFPALVHGLGLMYAAAALAGLVIAPAVITGYTLLDRLVPAGVKTEAYAWLNGSVGLGIATGAAVAGQLVDIFGPSTAFLFPPVTTALAALLVATQRGKLVAPVLVLPVSGKERELIAA